MRDFKLRLHDLNNSIHGIKLFVEQAQAKSGFISGERLNRLAQEIINLECWAYELSSEHSLDPLVSSIEIKKTLGDWAKVFFKNKKYLFTWKIKGHGGLFDGPFVYYILNGLINSIHKAQGLEVCLEVVEYSGVLEFHFSSDWKELCFEEGPELFRGPIFKRGGEYRAFVENGRWNVYVRLYARELENKKLVSAYGA